MQTAWTKTSKNDTGNPHLNTLSQTDFKNFPGRTLREDAVLITEGLLLQRVGAATSSVPLLEGSWTASMLPEHTLWAETIEDKWFLIYPGFMPYRGL